MTAGRGLIHSELPEQEEGRMEGFQLWLNLPAADKMTTPGYRDIPSEEIPELRLPGATVRVIAGESHGVAGAVQKAHTQPLYLDLHLEPGASFEQALPAGHNAFVYVYRGELVVDGETAATPVPRERMAVLANAADRDGVRVRAGADGARALLIAGQPLSEPIAQYGPFVMNRQAEIFQALADFRDGKFGDPPGR
jgi:redox-sensitive bicupin YhaK (pirin superfamily)